MFQFLEDIFYQNIDGQRHASVLQYFIFLQIIFKRTTGSMLREQVHISGKENQFFNIKRYSRLWAPTQRVSLICSWKKKFTILFMSVVFFSWILIVCIMQNIHKLNNCGWANSTLACYCLCIVHKPPKQILREINYSITLTNDKR